MNGKELYLLLGSNLGDRLKNIIKALQFLQEESGKRLKIVDFSSIYETEPEGVEGEHPRYLNMVIKCHSTLSLKRIFEITLHVERKLGRKDKGKKLPRTIDIDILLFGNRKLNTSLLTIPHPQILERKFVLHLLNEISPDIIHPETQKTVSQHLTERKNSSPLLYLPREEIKKYVYS